MQRKEQLILNELWSKGEVAFTLLIFDRMRGDPCGDPLQCDGMTAITQIKRTDDDDSHTRREIVFFSSVNIPCRRFTLSGDVNAQLAIIASIP